MSGFLLALKTLWSPTAAMTAAADQRRFFWPLFLLALVGVGFVVLAMPRVDFASVVEEAIDSVPEVAAKLTPYERVEKIETGRKATLVATFAGATVGQALFALAAGLFLWLGFKVAGGKPGFVASFAVASSAAMPTVVRDLLSVPALLRRESLRLTDLEKLLPSNLAALAPEGTPAPQLLLLAEADLFQLWVVFLVIIGMAHAAQVSKLRAGVVTFILWASYALVFRFAIPSLTTGGPS